MNPKQIYALIVAVASLTACGGGGEVEVGSGVGSEATDAQLAEFPDAASAEDLARIERDEDLAMNLSETGEDEFILTAQLGEERVHALKYEVKRSNVYAQVWTGGKSINDDDITAVAGMTKDAWNQPNWRVVINRAGQRSYSKFATGELASKDCFAFLEQCRKGTLSLLRALNAKMKSQIGESKCETPVETMTSVSFVYSEFNSTGRKLLQHEPNAVRMLAHGVTGLAMYTGINWVADLVGPNDPTKLSAGSKQVAFWLTSLYLTTFAGADVRNLSARSLIVLQNVAMRAGQAAINVAPIVGASLGMMMCPSASNFWLAQMRRNDDGVDIEMGNINRGP